MTQKILITGIAGFLGSNLSKRLVEEGHDVYGVDDLSAGHLRFINTKYFDKKIFVKDFSNQIILNKIKKQQYDIVIHLAAQPRVGYTIDYPYETNDTNVSKSLKLLNTCRGNIKRFINISSSAVYGNATIFPTPEYHDLNPTSPYALQKMTMEKYCKLFSSLYNIDTVSIRPFNIFGPNQIGTSAYATAVSAWLWAIKNNSYLRSDRSGEQSRDMIHVDNVVDIIVKILNKSSYVFNGDCFNAGTGETVSNNLILSWFKDKFKNCNIVNAPKRPGDVMKTQADISKCKTILNYSPVVKFWEGLESTSNWVMSQ